MAKRKIENPAADLFNKGEQQPTGNAPANVTPPIEQPAAQEQPKMPPAQARQGKPQQQPPAPLVVSPQQREPRSQRKQILLQPSVHDRAEEKCKKLGISMNEAINQLLQSWVDMD